MACNSAGVTTIFPKWQAPGKYTCVAKHCSARHNLFSWPNEKSDAEYWTNWVKQKNKSFEPFISSRLCCKHFSEDSFTNLYQYLLQFHSRLRLKQSGARPTIQFNNKTEADGTLTPRSRKKVEREQPLEPAFRRSVVQALQETPQKGQSRINRSVLWIDPVTSQQLLQTVSGATSQDITVKIGVPSQELMAAEEPLITLPSSSEITLEPSDNQEEGVASKQLQQQQLQQRPGELQQELGQEHQQQSTQVQMIPATIKYPEFSGSADEESPLKELVIKLEPCDILVSGQFTDIPTSPPSKVYKAERRLPVTHRIKPVAVAPIMYECEVLDCGFRTPRPAILEHHMTNHPIDCVLRPALDRLEEPEMDIPVKVVASAVKCKAVKRKAVKRKATKSKAKSKSRAVVPKVLSHTKSSAGIISHQDTSYHSELETHELSAQPAPDDTTNLELIESPPSTDERSGEKQTSKTEAPLDCDTTHLASGLNPEQTAALKELYATDRYPDSNLDRRSKDDKFNESESLMDDDSESWSDSEDEPERPDDSDSDPDRCPLRHDPEFLRTGLYFECKEAGCEYKTIKKDNMKQHWNVVHNPNFKAQLCNICGREVRHLNSHMYNQHTKRDESKLLKCKFCDYKTYTHLRMQRHEMIHSGAKPYKCTQCNYSSNQNTNLNTHMRTHTGDKPYRCPSCDYTAAHNVTLKGHIKAQHPE